MKKAPENREKGAHLKALLQVQLITFISFQGRNTPNLFLSDR